MEIARGMSVMAGVTEIETHIAGDNDLVAPGVVIILRLENAACVRHLAHRAQVVAGVVKEASASFLGSLLSIPTLTPFLSVLYRFAVFFSPVAPPEPRRPKALGRGT
jgi:hypothetical protein